MQIRSILSFLIKLRSCASPSLVIIFELLLTEKSRFELEIVIDFSLISTPIALRSNNLASTKVVPLPKNWSIIQSLVLLYLKIRFLGI